MKIVQELHAMATDLFLVGLVGWCVAALFLVLIALLVRRVIWLEATLIEAQQAAKRLRQTMDAVAGRVSQ